MSVPPSETTPADGVELRAWRRGDDIALAEIFGDPASPVDAQNRELFGSSGDEPFARSIVATDGGVVIGAGALVSSSLHPTRRWAAVEVAPAARRAGVGRLLLARLAELNAEAPDGPLPLQAKVAVGSAGEAFASAVGFHAIQTSRFVTVPPGRLPQAELSENRGAGTHIEITATGSATLIEALGEWYTRIHASWSPVAPLTPGRIDRAFLGAGTGASAGALLWRDGVLRAFAVSYPAGAAGGAAEGLPELGAAAALAQERTELLLGDTPEAEAKDVAALLGHLTATQPVDVEVDDDAGLVAKATKLFVAGGLATVAGGEVRVVANG